MKILLNQLINLLNSYRILYHEHRNEKLFSRYLTRKNQKKALFYLNPQKKGVIFGIGHHGTSILETLPTLPMLADDTRIAVIKFLITKPEDIEQKALKFIIEQCIDIAGKTFFKMENFSLKTLEETHRLQSSKRRIHLKN